MMVLKNRFFHGTPGIGISNLIEVINFDPRWDHDILISSLKNMFLYRVRLNRDNLIFAEKNLDRKQSERCLY